MRNTATQHLTQHDPALANVIAATPPPHVESTHDVFFDLMSCVLEQQIHYRSTKKTFQKMLDQAQLSTLSPDNFEVLERLALPHVTLSASKYETLAGILDLWRQQPAIEWAALSDDEVATRLSSIKGIGRWTIDMILLYTLGRPDVFPADDFHLKQIMVSLYGLDPQVRLRAQMLDVSRHWHPHASTAVLYLLEHKKTRKGF
jgi:DNA-3-methyladenine glycosylase II